MFTTKGKRQLYHVTTIYLLSLSFDFYCFHTKITSFMPIFEQPGFGLFFLSEYSLIWKTINLNLTFAVNSKHDSKPFYHPLFIGLPNFQFFQMY